MKQIAESQGDTRRVEKLRQRLYSRMPLIGGWRGLRASQALARDGSPEALAVLEEAASHSDDGREGAASLEALRKLAEQGHTGAQESLCRLVIAYAHAGALETAVAAHYAPRDEHQRALFLFLSEQWDSYDSLDFDHSLLEAVYMAADESLRRRVADKARQHGRVEWIGVAVGGRKSRRLGEMGEMEWEAVVAVLEGSRRWSEMWRLAQEAPPMWSARLLGRLGSVEWAAGDDELEGYGELASLAEGLEVDRPPLGKLVGLKAVLEGHEGLVLCLAVSPDGRVLASGSYGGNDKTVRLWSLPDGEHLRTLEGHEDSVWCLAVSPDGRVLASGGDDKTVRLWSLPDGEHLRTLEGHEGGVRCLAVSPDGRVLASGGRDKTVRLWSLPDGEHLRKLEGHQGSAVRCLAVSPDGRVLASGSDDKTVRLWSLPDGERLRTLEGHEGAVACLAVSPDGRVLASGGGSGEGTVRLWSLPDGEPLRTLEGHEGSVNCLAVSPDGRVLASGSGDDTVRLWSLPDGEHLRTLEGHEGSVFCLAVSPDGRVLASGGDDNTVRLWTVRLWTLGLSRLSFLPIGQTTVEDLAWVEETLRAGEASELERRWLDFLAALMRRRRRFDIGLEDAAVIEAGEFDIEIER